MWIYVVLGISIGIRIILGISASYGIKKACYKDGAFTDKFLFFWYIMEAFHHIPSVLASFHAANLQSLKGTPCLTLQPIETELLEAKQL
ncbi:MAG: hypothetical protein GXP60_06785 [Epsilonproteobacteria bacterium]|nr:hypothetical protein [Campylobacterota bacterium]